MEGWDDEEDKGAGFRVRVGDRGGDGGDRLREKEQQQDKQDAAIKRY